MVGALLGADEFGFATAPLIAAGCIMMRKCHLNTCPVGVATQDPVLRARFQGKPEHVINFFFFVAEEVREYMAALGFRSFSEMIGKTEILDKSEAIDHWKAKGLDFTRIFHKPEVPKQVAIYNSEAQDHHLDKVLDRKLIELCKPAIEEKKPVKLELPIRNTDRTTGAMLSGTIAKLYGHAGLPEDTIWVSLKGSAGQSFGAWLAHGVTLDLEGEANDYVGKGLSGGRIIVRPPADSGIVPEESIIVGNTVLYGAIAGECYFRGIGGERFAVRNSGAIAVVEGTGDHGCEYMTGGVVVVIGPTGRNFAAGMSGGIAYVLDEDGDFERRCNLAMVELEPVPSENGVMERSPPSDRRPRKPRARRRDRHDALRRGAALSADRAPPALHGLRAGARHPRRLERLPAEIRQGDAGRISPRARGDGAPAGARHDRAWRDRDRSSRRRQRQIILTGGDLRSLPEARGKRG